jgi:tetratricopeptide (TPR) repeat protein
MSEYKQQLERCEANLAVDPGNPHLLAMAFDLSMEGGETEGAARHLHTALQAHAADGRFQARRGHLFLAQRQWGEAATVFETVLQREDDVNLAYNLAYALQQQGRYADAAAALEPYRAQAEFSPAMALLLIRALHHLGRRDEAIALVEAFLEQGRAEPALLAAGSLVCMDGGRLELAEKLSELALAATPGQAPVEALVTAGSLALARNDGAAAMACFEQVLAQHPEEGRSWSGIGSASLMLHDFVTAQAQLERAVVCMPEHIGSWHLLGWSRIFNDNLGGAQMAFQAALHLDRNFGESHGGMSVVQALQGRREEAEAAIERAQKLDPQSLSAAYARMVLSGQTKDPVRFQALAKRLLSSRQGLFGQNLGELLEDHAS